MIEAMNDLQLIRQDGKLYQLTIDGSLEHIGWLLPQVREHRDRLLQQKQKNRTEAD